MQDKPWWPKGIVQSHDDSTISTSWGTLPLYVEEVTAQWWERLENKWGNWPEISSFELIKEDKIGMWYDIGDYEALVVPIPRCRSASRLSKNQQLKNLLNSILQLPVAGCDKEGDHVLIYPKEAPAKITGESLSNLHKALISGGWSTPNDEHGWNDRLKIVEDKLKTNTLWRAPHSSNTIGTPRIELHDMRPIPVPISEKLILDSDINLPMIRQAVKYDVFERWCELMPPKYASKSVLRTATGGVAHIKYDIKIMEKAEAVAFDYDNPEVDKYLSKVDRFQAKLGNMRLVKMGVPLAIFGLLGTLWLDRAGEIGQPVFAYWTFSLIGVISGVIYSIMEPDWRQTL